MIFVAVILALFIDRVVWSGTKERRYGWFRGYCRLAMRNPFGEWLAGTTWGAILVLLPIILALAWLQGVFDGLGGGLFELVFGTAVLLYAIGPRDLGHDGETFIAARDSQDQAEADAIAERMDRAFDTGLGEPQRTLSVARAIIVGANHRLVAPLFWFVIFGAVGAATYRLIVLLRDRRYTEACPEAFISGTEAMQHIVDWAPARLTAAAYATAGNFDAVGHAWKNFDYTPAEGKPRDEADQLLLATGLAALDTYPDMGDSCDLLTELPPVVEDALALVWRALTLLVLLLAGGSLVAALT